LKIGVILLLIGVLLMLFAYWKYKKTQNSLMPVKKDDLVAYYLELTYRLLPLPLWSACLGIVLFIIGLIWVVVSIPLVI